MGLGCWLLLDCDSRMKMFGLGYCLVVMIVYIEVIVCLLVCFVLVVDVLLFWILWFGLLKWVVVLLVCGIDLCLLLFNSVGLCYICLLVEFVFVYLRCVVFV